MALDRRFVDHAVGRVSGVTAEDTRISAAEKAIKTMREAGFSERDIRRAELMVERARARGVT